MTPPTIPVRRSPWSRLGAPLAAALVLAAALAWPGPAAAQQVVARVNGEPITAVDLAQRMRLKQISGDKNITRQQTLDELIDEQLKLQTAARYRIDISEAEVDGVVANMAARMRTTPTQFAKQLQGAGLSINTLKRKLRADIAWNGIIRGKFQASLQVREKDVMAFAEKSGKDAQTTSYQYSLQPILLVVPRGAGDGVFEARRREAEALRARFQGCAEGVRLARGLRDVAVRPLITRTSADFSVKQREVIDATPVGKLTPPDVTSSGVEVFAVCEKKQGIGGAAASGAVRDAKEELFGEKFQAKGKEYLRELRRSASIQIQ
jgi:peptidyl-prolyl cis-trans isomerase SurA